MTAPQNVPTGVPSLAPVGRTSCPHVAAYGPRCVTPTPAGVCGHINVFHELKKGTRIRTACTIHAGPKAEPCGCPAYEPEEVTA